MHKTLISLLLLFSSSWANAYDFEANGIYYNFTNGSAGSSVAVTRCWDWDLTNGYMGIIVLPETVIYNGKTYNVTQIGQNAFWECSELISITIPNSVITIVEGAFVR